MRARAVIEIEPRGARPPRGDYRRLARLFERATPVQRYEGLHWYRAALVSCRHEAIQYGVSVERFAAVVAVLSPRLTWGRNLVDANRVFQGRRDNFSSFGHNLRNARAIARGGDIDTHLRGPKVRVFWRCLLGKLDTPCLDSHAMNAWYGSAVFHKGRRTQLRVGERREATRDYRRLAHHHGIAPAQAQAVVWVVWREQQRTKRRS